MVSYGKHAHFHRSLELLFNLSECLLNRGMNVQGWHRSHGIGMLFGRRYTNYLQVSISADNESDLMRWFAPDF